MRQRLVLFALAALLTVGAHDLAAAKTRSPRHSHSSHSQPAAVPAGDSSGCDVTLWRHVYNPTRLTKKQACVTVTGTIVDATKGRRADGVRHEKDGDTHGWLKLDPEFTHLLNAGNKSKE